MSPDRKPWLYVKRLNSWNPLSAVKPLLCAQPSDEIWDETAEPAPAAAPTPASERRP